jgi:hypothetical protein
MPNPQTSAARPTPLNRREFEARIIAKAWKNPAYKQRLLANPKALLQQEIAAIDPSVVLPAELQVQVHEEAPNVYHLVLPRNPKDISLGELVGDNLELVAPQTASVAVVTVGNVIVAPIANMQVNLVNIQAVVQSVVGIQVVVAAVNNIAATNANAVSAVIA